MHAKRLTHILVTLAGLFIAFGALLNLWFYAVAGFVIALYLAWRFFAFQATIATLQLDVRRDVDKTVVERGGHVTIDVSVSAPAAVEGRFTDVLPNGVELVHGTNSVYLSLQAGATSTWRYTVMVAKREAVRIGRVAFTPDNGLFVHTMRFTTAAREITQPPYAVSVEGGAGGVGGASGVTSASVQSLYRARASAGLELSHIRPFVSGDPFKRIHWKASARLDKLMTKEFMSKLEDASGAGGSMSLIVDQGATMARGPAGATELDFAVNVASQLVKSAVSKGDRIGLVTYDDNGVATSLETGHSLPHVSSVVRSLNELEPSVSVRRPRRKMQVTGGDVIRIKKHFESTRDQEVDDDVRHFRHVISHMYTYGEGYMRGLKRSPGFRAIATSLERAHGPSTVVLISDLENDFSPLSEGVRLAARRGMRVFVIALFSELFQQLEDPLFSIEDVYVAYDAHRRRMRKLEQISGVKVIEANAAETLQPILREARVV